MILPSDWMHRPRLLAAVIAAACAAALATGLFVQHALGFMPCSLCVLQRLGFIGVMLLAMPFVALSGASAALVLAPLILVAALAGFGVASYQVWLQAFPPLLASCGRGIAGFFDGWPIEEALAWVFEAEGDCSKPVTLFGLVSLAQLGLVAFALMSAASTRLVWLTAAARVRRPA